MNGASHNRAGAIRLAVVSLLAAALGACTTVAEHRKLEQEVLQLKQRGAVGSDSRAVVADIHAQIEGLRTDLTALQGRLEVAEHRSREALEEARAARRTAHEAGSVPSAEPAGEPSAEGTTTPEELRAYREAYAAWRSDDNATCVDRFREFLQTHPASAYADDAAYWMADCHFKQGDYRTAVLRFDDVAGRYPTGNKAADALYRQGEALLRLGYGEAAMKAFERVLNEYPDSPRANEAKRQVDLLRSTG